MTSRIFTTFAIFALAFTLAACGGGGAAKPDDSQAIAADTSFSSKGDATRGQAVFASTCVSCHTTGTDNLVGPGLAGVFSPEGPTLPAGIDYAGKLPNGKVRTETNIAEWIKTGGTGKIGTMTSQALDDQQLADVIAYLRTLNK